MKKIIFFVDLISNGGFESHLYNLCWELRGKKQPLSISIFSNHTNPNVKIFEERHQLRVSIFGSPRYNENIYQKSFANIVRFFLITQDIFFFRKVTVYFSSINKIWWIYFKVISYVRKIKVVYNPVGDPVAISSKIKRNINLIKKVNPIIIVESQTHFDLLPRIYENIFILPHISNIIKTDCVQKNISLFFRIAFLGRLDYHKGVMSILDVYKKLNIENSILTFYGSEGDAIEQLKRAVSEDEFLLGKVIFEPGWRSSNELKEIHRNIDLVLLLSKSEGLPLTLIECLAYGTPFVATNIGSINEMVKDIPLGYLINTQDVENIDIYELRQFIMGLLNTQNERQVLINLFNRKYSREVLFPKYLDLIC